MGKFDTDGLTTTRALVVEEDSIACKHPIGFSKVDYNPIGIQLGSACKEGFNGIVYLGWHSHGNELRTMGFTGRHSLYGERG